MNSQQEQAQFTAEVQQVEAWFKSPRFKNVIRPYTAEQGIRLLLCALY